MCINTTYYVSCENTINFIMEVWLGYDPTFPKAPLPTVRNSLNSSIVGNACKLTAGMDGGIYDPLVSA